MDDTTIKIITALSAPILTTLLGITANFIFSERKKRSSRSKWAFNCLSNNKAVSNYLTEYKNTISPSNKIIPQFWYFLKWAILFPIFIALPFVFLIIIKYNDVISIFNAWFYPLIAIGFSLHLFRNYDKIKSELTNINDVKYTSLSHSQINNCLPQYRKLIDKIAQEFEICIYFSGLPASTLFNIWINRSSFLNPINTGIFWEITQFFLYSTIIVVMGLKYRDLNHKLKSVIGKTLSAKYKDQLPVIHIKSKDFDCSGKIYNLTDNKLITLNNDGKIISSEWEHILLMECEGCKL